MGELVRATSETSERSPARIVGVAKVSRGFSIPPERKLGSRTITSAAEAAGDRRSFSRRGSSRRWSANSVGGALDDRAPRRVDASSPCPSGRELDVADGEARAGSSGSAAACRIRNRRHRARRLRIVALMRATGSRPASAPARPSDRDASRGRSCGPTACPGTAPRCGEDRLRLRRRGTAGAFPPSRLGRQHCSAAAPGLVAYSTVTFFCAGRRKWIVSALPKSPSAFA